MKRITTVIIGAGQAGLAMSYHLSRRAIDHVLIERGEVANSWRTERWDSLRLLTPNWQSRLPGYEYSGDDPDGYMNMAEVVRFVDGYARFSGAPVETHTRVTSVVPTDDGYLVRTDRGTEWHCRTLVMASGACNLANVPPVAAQIPEGITNLTPMTYRNPDQLDAGGVLVVGASATGVQLAEEIRRSGRPVTLCAGEHVRVPRLYRGRDIKWWMDAAGILDMHYTEVDDITRARRVPSLQLVGSPEKTTLDLNALMRTGVEVTGRLSGINGSKLHFSGSLGNMCALADLKMNRLLDTTDQWACDHHLEGDVGEPERFEQTRVSDKPRLEMDLGQGSVKTIVWATGYKPDYSWLQVPVFDRKGRLIHDGGVVNAPGLYVLGLPFLQRRKSSLIDGVGGDAEVLADHLCAGLYRAAA